MGRIVGYDPKRAGIAYIGSSRPLDADLSFIETDIAVPDSDLIQHYEVRRGVLVPKDRPTKRIAFVSVYGVPCGIATYGQWLWPELLERIDDGHVFAERERGAPEMPGVTRCWERGKPLNELIDNIDAYEPDLVLVSHEYGYFPDARAWLSFMGQLSKYRVVVTLHSVYAAHKDKILVESACPEIVVHTDTAKAVLLTKGITQPVHVIPHGSLPCVSRERHWNLYRSSHTIVQSGFSGRYKGWDNALEVVTKLRLDYPDVFYTALISEREPGQAKSFVAELHDQARRLGIQDHVAFLRGYQSEAVLDAFYRTNSVCLLPYRDQGEHTVHGCSGAARRAMTSGIPVVASGVPLFDDLVGVCDRPLTTDGWAEAVSRLWEGDPAAQIDRQCRFLEATSWSSVAEHYVRL